MRTVHEVKVAVLDHLKAVVPLRMSAAGAAAHTPRLWSDGPFMAFPGRDEFPAVYIEEVEARPQLEEVDDWGDPIWRVDYQLIVEVVARRHGDTSASEVRALVDRAVTEALLDDRSLNAAGFAIVPIVADVADERQMVRRYSPPFTVIDGVDGAAVQIEFIVATAETLPREPLADAPTDVHISTEHLED